MDFKSHRLKCMIYFYYTDDKRHRRRFADLCWNKLRERANWLNSHQWRFFSPSIELTHLEARFQFNWTFNQTLMLHFFHLTAHEIAFIVMSFDFVSIISDFISNTIVFSTRKLFFLCHLWRDFFGQFSGSNCIKILLCPHIKAYSLKSALKSNIWNVWRDDNKRKKMASI